MTASTHEIPAVPVRLNGTNPTHAVAGETTQAVADRINQRMGSAVEAIIAVGIELLHAKERLPHGEFGRLFKNHPDAVAQPLRISQRTADVFMRIADHPVLSNSQHVANLPVSWGTLGELARLEAPVLEVMLADGRVHPEMERADAMRLVAGDPVDVRLLWQGMPEFVQEDLTPQSTIHFHFATREARATFAKLVEPLIGQTITEQTRALWYPKAEIGRMADRRFIDASPIDDEPEDAVVEAAR